MKTTTSSIRSLNFAPIKLSILTIGLWISSSDYCLSQEPEALPELQKAEYEKALERQQRILDEQSKAIEKLQIQINALNEKVVPNKKKPLPKKQVSTDANSSEQQKPEKKSAVTKPVGQAPPEKATRIEVSPIPKLSTNRSGVLTRKGAIIIEPALGYSYNDSNRVFLDAYSFIPALVVGLIDLREIKRHTFITSISTRYGLTDRWEIDIKVPYIGRVDRQRSRPISIGVSEDDVFRASGHGYGDIELSTRYQLNYGLNGGPIYVANLSATIPTGTSPFEVDYIVSTPGAVFPTELPTGSGYYSIQPSLTALYPSDPGVLFGNLSYAYNMDTNEDVGKVNPGDSFGVSFGLGLSLNERTSLSLGYSHKHVLKSKIDRNEIDGSSLDIGQLIVGYSFNYSQQTNINLSLNIGVTDDAQDIRLNLRLPMLF